MSKRPLAAAARLPEAGARPSRRRMQEAEEDERVFKALADARRRRILDFLEGERRTTGEVCAQFPDLDRCTVMVHLGVLERAGLVIVKREGRVRWNYLNALPIKAISDRWINPYAARAVTLLARVQRQLEADR